MPGLSTGPCARIVALAVSAFTASVDVAYVYALDQPVAGQTLSIKRSTAGKEALVIVFRDPALVFPAFDGPDDPTLNGLTVDLFGATGERARFEIPAGLGAPGWKRTSGTARRYTFVNRDAPAGVSEVRTIGMHERQTLKIIAKRTGLALAGPQGAVGIRVTTGDVRHCALFAASTVQKDDAGRFIARNATAVGLTDCETPTLGGVVRCGDGFIDAPDEECDGPYSCTAVPFGAADCTPPGVPGECTCCGGQCADLVGCCGPGISPVPAPGPCNESCISTSCEPPWTCSPGYACVGGSCCGDPGAYCYNLLIGGLAMPCCPGTVCGGLDGFFAFCCVPDGGACTSDSACCSAHCGIGGTCAPP